MMQELFPGTTDALNNLSLYKQPTFEDVSAEELEHEEFMETMEHYERMGKELGMESHWSIYDGGPMQANEAFMVSKMRKVRYHYVDPEASLTDIQHCIETGKNTCMVEVTSWAVDGTVASLWRAAESCIKQSGTHHSYIEDFEVLDDGTLLLITGS